MILRLENDNGFSIDIGGKSAMKLMDYPDLGCPVSSLYSDKIPGRDGEVFRNAELGVRDITLKMEAGIPLCILSRVLSPGTSVTLYVDDKWLIRGRITGINKLSRPERLALPVITVGIRCFDPYFYKINSERSISFYNKGGGIYATGGYTYQKLTLINDGDVACPIDVTMSSTYDSTVSGLLNYISWNNGNPEYTGLVFKLGTDVGVEHFITTDTSSDSFFESWSALKRHDYFLLPPGETVLYAQNVEGNIKFNPRYLYIDGRDI